MPILPLYSKACILQPLTPARLPPEPFYPASCGSASRRWEAGRTLALFRDQLYDTGTVILRQDGVALWLSIFSEVRIRRYFFCGGGWRGSGEMRQKRKGAKGRGIWAGMVEKGRTSGRHVLKPVVPSGIRCLIQSPHHLQPICGLQPLAFSFYLLCLLNKTILSLPFWQSFA